ncbi:MAG: hypothetical protein Q4C67_11185 [Deinococcus sp.]|nr:hypothetical protein [Deinococcus sp.]
MTSRDPRPRTALLPDGRIDQNTELRFEILFRDLETVTGNAEEVRQRQARLEAQAQKQQSLFTRVEQLEAGMKEQAKIQTAQAARLGALEARVAALENKPAAPPPTEPTP